MISTVTLNAVLLNLQYIVPVILMLGLLILIHEFGHFVFAKLAGVIVPEFAIGFGPGFRLFQWKGTLFTFRIFPFGGFVRLKGLDEIYLETKPDVSENRTGAHPGLPQDAQNEESAGAATRTVDSVKSQDDITGNFRYKPALWRLLILFGGILFNTLLAYAIFTSHALITGKVDSIPVVTEVLPGRPAARAGFRPGDIVRSVDGVSLPLNEIVRKIARSSGQPMNFVVERSGQSLNLTVIPEPKTPGDPRSRPIIGVVFVESPVAYPRVVSVQPDSAAARAGLKPDDEVVTIEGISPTAFFARVLTPDYEPDGDMELVVRRGSETISLKFPLKDISELGFVLDTRRLPMSLPEAFVFAHRQVTSIGLGFFRFFGSLIRGKKMEGRITGPVGIIQLGSRIARQGMLNLLYLMGYISLVLAIVNFLPIPALDGGHIFFLLVEQALGRRINPQFQMVIHTLGFVALLLLLVVITFFDIKQILTN